MGDYPAKLFEQMRGKRCGASDVRAAAEKAIAEGRRKVEGDVMETPKVKRSLITQASVRRRIEANITEAEIQRGILDYLNLLKVPYSVTDAAESFNRSGQRVRRVRAGWPDIIACVPEERHGDGQFWGRMVAIEVKKPAGGRLSYGQADTLMGLHQAGALVVVARSHQDVAVLLEKRRTDQKTLNEIERALKRGR